MDAHQIHSMRLEELLKNLEQIGENTRNIDSVIKEPTWYHEGSKQERSLCDAFLLYNDESFRPLELKRSMYLRRKGRSQIKEGYKYGISHLRRNIIRPGKLVFYDASFYFESVPVPKIYHEEDLYEILRDISV